MDIDREKYYLTDLVDLHSHLLANDLVLEYLTGDEIVINGNNYSADEIVSLKILESEFKLSVKDFAHLFVVFNKSRVLMQLENPRGRDWAPEGCYVKTINHELIAQQHKNNIGIFLEEADSYGIAIDALHIDSFNLKEDAPSLLGTIGFCLCALVAYLNGFSRIDLVGAGRNSPKDKNIGYFVWPKLGFDSALDLIDRSSWPQEYLGFRTIQDIVKIDEKFWEDNGGQLLMSFDLSPGSVSWKKLLDYTRRKLLWSTE